MARLLPFAGDVWRESIAPCRCWRAYSDAASAIIPEVAASRVTTAAASYRNASIAEFRCARMCAGFGFHINRSESERGLRPGFERVVLKIIKVLSERSGFQS